MAKRNQRDIPGSELFKENVENLTNLWSDFSAQMEDKLHDLFESSTTEYKDIYKNWTDISEKMSKQMLEFTTGNEGIYKNLYNSWKEYSERLNADLVKVTKADDKSHSEFLDFWSNYSENFNDKLSELMRDGLKEQYELYELWMDTFAKSATEGSKSGDIPSIVNKYRLDAFNRFQDFYSKKPSADKDEQLQPGEQFYKQYEEIYDYWINTSQKMLDEVMRSPAYGNFLAQSINSSMDSRKFIENMMIQNLKSMGIPTMNELEEIRIELKNLSDQIDELNRNIRDLSKKR